jgi:hypothetical protein
LEKLLEKQLDILKALSLDESRAFHSESKLGMSWVVLKGVIVAAMMASKKEKHLGKLMD